MINTQGEVINISENALNQKPININENIEQKLNPNSIYQIFLLSLKKFQLNNFIPENLENIKYYFNQLKGLYVFIIETEQLNYWLKYGTELNESNIIPSDKISDSIKYSCINMEICNYGNNQCGDDMRHAACGTPIFIFT